MNSRALLVENLEKSLNVNVDHREFVKAEAKIERFVEKCAARSTRSSTAWLLGLPRFGKSHAAKRVLGLKSVEQSSVAEVDGQKIAYVVLNPGASATSVCVDILQALGDHYPRRNSLAELKVSVANRIRGLGISGICFDEVQHTTMEGKTKSTFAFSEDFKAFRDSLPGIPMIYLGLPAAAELRDVNAQFKDRTSAPDYLLPYFWGNTEDRIAFIQAVNAFIKPLECVNFIDRQTEQGGKQLLHFISSMYLLSGGRIGIIHRFMQELLEAITCDKTAVSILPQHLVQAYNAVDSGLLTVTNPFRNGVGPTDRELEMAWASKMRAFGLKALVPASVMTLGHRGV